MILNTDLSFETKFYTIDDILHGRCEKEVRELIKEFTKDILEDMRYEYSDHECIYAFKFTVTGYAGEDVATIEFGIYSIYADINFGLKAEEVSCYSRLEEVPLEKVQDLLYRIELPTELYTVPKFTGLKEAFREDYDCIDEMERIHKYFVLDLEEIEEIEKKEDTKKYADVEAVWAAMAEMATIPEDKLW